MALDRDRRRRQPASRLATAFVALVALAFGGSALPAAGQVVPGQAPQAPLAPSLSGPWIETTPDQVGLDAARLESAAARAALQPRFRSLIVARRGRLAFERYFAGATSQTLFDVRSVTKSIVSLLTGTAIRSGLLPTVDASIAPYLSSSYHVDTEDAAVTVRHLLTMTSGFSWDEYTGTGYNDWILSGRQVQYVLDRPHASPPGTVFTYNSGAVHVLGAVLQSAARRTLPELAREVLFEPLGILDADVAWEAVSQGYVNGGSGIDLRGRDLLKLGQLVLQRGWSAERSIVPEAWITQTTLPAFTWRQDYGPQRSSTYGWLWWVSDGAPPSAFAWGYGGQFVYVVPSLELVVVATTEWRGIVETTPAALADEVLGVIVDGVLPAVAPVPCSTCPAAASADLLRGAPLFVARTSSPLAGAPGRLH
jgi:CubicO group peptidase (beta-lactamase class C family)